MAHRTLKCHFVEMRAPVFTDMREHVLLFCLLGLVLTAAIILVSAPGTVTWALSLMID